MTMRNLMVMTAFVGASAALLACHKSTENSDSPATSALPQPRPLAEKKPLDHVEPGALIEGTEKAYALPLPYGFHVTRTAPDVAAYGDTPARPVALYIQQRVRDGNLVEKDGVFLFSSVRLPAEPNRILNIEIDRVRDFGAQILVTDKTPPPDMGASTPAPADRLKRVGLDAHGRILDPSHLE